MQILLDCLQEQPYLPLSDGVKGLGLYANSCARTVSNDCVTLNLDERCEPPLPIDYTLNLVWRSSKQLVAVGIVLCIPSLQFGLRYPDKLMSDSAVLLVNHALLADFVSLPLGDEVDPEDVVYTTEQDARNMSV